MLAILQILVVTAAVAFFAYVVHLVAQDRLRLKYSLLWMLLSVVAVVCALFPMPLYEFAHLLGFVNPSNFIFFLGLFLLMVICLSLSVIISKQAIRIKNLTQEQALLAKRLETLSEHSDNVDR